MYDGGNIRADLSRQMVTFALFLYKILVKNLLCALKLKE